MMKEKIITAVFALFVLGVLVTLGAMVIESPVVGVILVGMIAVVGLIVTGAQYVK